MARSRKKHVQEEMVFRTWGGKRVGAGRKPAKGRRREAHCEREAFSKDKPLHIVLRTHPELGSLRNRDFYNAVRAASFHVLGRADFRVCHISIQATHIHLIVEADDRHALSSGMRSFSICAARRLNSAYSVRTDRTRRGQVFVDRYHVEVIDNARQARHTLAYVLNNWRKHGEHLKEGARDWKLDPYSTAMAFYGWKEQPAHWSAPESYRRMGVSMPETWLLYGAWKLFPAISIYDVPSRPRR